MISMNNAPKPSRDRLTTTTDENKIELAEQELSRTVGGTGASAGFLHVKIADVLVAAIKGASPKGNSR